ncbi:MAG: polyribonucleotide nucleotidyltransferase [Clostridia bacterium]|nr:polyribonucleotide nucleotidyltransferase [Clostridia bacterium]
MHHIFQMELAGRQLVIETGKYAQQAGGSVLIHMGESYVLVTATGSDTPREGVDFFPLSVEYQEKLYAAGKIPGGFIKREGRPSEKAILACRLIDRPLRPLFPKGFHNDVQVVATVLSVDSDVPTDVLAMVGSSAALAISNLPFMGPTGSVLVGLVDGQIVINPDQEQQEKSDMHLVVSGTKDAVMMVEAGAKEVSEEVMLNAILTAHEEIKKIVAFINDIAAEVGKPKMEFVAPKPDEEFERKVREFATEKVRWSLDTTDRYEREERSAQVKEETVAHFAEEYPDSAGTIGDILYSVTKEIVRDKIINHQIRPDGRAMNEVRPIWCEVGILPHPHGSAVFTRGQTQVMSIATLGAMGEVQILDGLTNDDMKRYMHHYNMPPFSTGEAKPMRSPGRREIGHGALAERALEPMLPSEEEFPYAIRVVSEAISSNGSTSMASVCGSTLSLMDAGVPLKAPVAGVAMGLIKDDSNGNIAIMTDIQGLEDFLGDMDFKVAGTAEGITAIQMDIKIKGIDEQILRRALAQAREGRLFILNKMLEVLPEPRKELSKYAPKIITFSIDPEKIGEVVGPRGKTINKIIAETGVKIDIEDDGRVYISTPDSDAAKAAKKQIQSIVREIKVGDVFKGKVVRIMPFGAFVELLPGKDGMVHISKLAGKRIEKVEDYCNIGDTLLVKVNEIDKQGRINLIHHGVREDEYKEEE